ncbi:hypothetical protein C4B63_8g195 [Trypanosoma cruzi]|uniref:Uncharacterized protein n=1 Tax=Trypanosoma cruzi TaxID=5693 RepID=A0A2V2VUP5_TRYCR|nr:hypothetical protein C4B63_8g195 [Trypanosoma cruzi]
MKITNCNVMLFFFCVCVCACFLTFLSFCHVMLIAVYTHTHVYTYILYVCMHACIHTYILYFCIYTFGKDMRGCGVLCAGHKRAAVIATTTCSLGPQTLSPSLTLWPVTCAATPVTIPTFPPPMRGSFIDRNPVWASFNEKHTVKSFRHRIVSSADVSLRPPQFYLSNEKASAEEAAVVQKRAEATDSYGEQLDEISARWAAKFYGRVTFGPRNYPYPSSRWLARRFKMKKHRIIKRFRFRRYKLAAVANLPFAKMIRVGLLPELKSSKTKKGDDVEADLSGRLVSAVRSSGGKKKGNRGRPKSKYQI